MEYSLPLAEWIEVLLDFLTTHLSGMTRAFSAIVEVLIDAFESLLLYLPAPIMIILLVALIWKISDRKTGIFSLIGLGLIWNLGYWEPTMSTISLVLISTLIAILLGVPLGIIGALNDKFHQIITPILDFMQTMPAFVYLIPAIPFFGLGTVAASFATVIFSIPPAIRLTTLGIRQVPKELIEAADAFGTTPKQKLLKVQIPIAIPTIMAGVNQTIMLSLSMVVIAAMIGAKGLGGVVWKAIQRLKPGMGFEAGIAIVIIAMILDKITKHLTKSKREK
ncbi:MAG: ABC transporter permease [Fusobacteriota bacterium]